MDADPRGPLKRITKVERIDGAVWVTRECGHRDDDYAPHFSYTVGNKIHCFECGPKAKKGPHPNNASNLVENPC